METVYLICLIAMGFLNFLNNRTIKNLKAENIRLKEKIEALEEIDDEE